MVKTQQEKVEVEKSHSILTNAVCVVQWFFNVAGWRNKTYWTLKIVKLGGQDEAQPIKLSQIIYYFFFPTFSPLPHGPKSTRLDKIYISTKKFSLSEAIIIRAWINTFGNLLLETMADSPVWFTILTNDISSNPIPHMLVPFFVPSTLTRKNSIEG